MDRVSVSEAEGSGFDSRRAHQSGMELGTFFTVPFFVLASSARAVDARL